MGVSYKNLDCLADVDSELYMLYTMQSQALVPWAAQAAYGKYTVYFGAATVGVVCAKHVLYRLRDYRRRHGRVAATFGGSMHDVVAAYCRLFGYLQTPRWLVAWCSAPSSMGKLAYAAAALVYVLCCCLVPHFWYRGCMGFGLPPLAVRAGIMAAALMPFVFALLGKLSVVARLTGMGYEKLNWVHQLVGVATLVLAVIHCVPFIHQSYAEGGSANVRVAFRDPMYRSGIAPFVLLVLLCTLFKREIRRRVYELSLHAHWLVACGFFAALTYHVYDSLDMQDYMWAALAVWGVQWVHRVLTSGLARTRPAHIRRLGSASFEVAVHTKAYKWRPGQHCFLRFPSVRMLDNHPFTVASVVESEHMKFIVVPRGGLTRVLHAALDSDVAKHKVMVDGPYGGCARDPLAFGKVLLLATGSGVTATLPYLLHLAAAADGPEVHFVWIVKHYDDILWVRDELEQALASRRVSVEVHVVHDHAAEAKLPFAVHFGKPNVLLLVDYFGHLLARRNMVVSSGSASMQRAVSERVAQLQIHVINNCRAVEEVYLHTETFGW